MVASCAAKLPHRVRIVRFRIARHRRELRRVVEGTRRALPPGRHARASAAGAAIPPRWADTDFDDSEWEPAVELSAGTFAPNRKRIPVEPFISPEHDDI